MNIWSGEKIGESIARRGRVVIVPVDVFGLAELLRGYLGVGVDGLQVQQGAGLNCWDVFYYRISVLPHFYRQEHGCRYIPSRTKGPAPRMATPIDMMRRGRSAYTHRPEVRGWLKQR